MEKIMCVHSECGKEFEIGTLDETGIKQIQCPHCFRSFYIKKTEGKIASFKIDIADMA